MIKAKLPYLVDPIVDCMPGFVEESEEKVVNEREGDI